MTGFLRRPSIVVPCFNEEARIDESEFVRLAKTNEIRLLFVDDGSSDGTSKILNRMAVDSTAIEVLSLPRNQGKGEAVRQGLLALVAQKALVVGYYDADMATPTDELLRLVSILQRNSELRVVIGSRVSLMGRSIRRTHMRHYLGRLYASVAAIALGTPIYDTQCGAKVFLNCPELQYAIGRPFRTSWSFDVELLDRLLHGSSVHPGLELDAFLEVPLQAWRDVHGSKVSAFQGCKAMVDVAELALRHSCRNQRQEKWTSWGSAK